MRVLVLTAALGLICISGAYAEDGIDGAYLGTYSNGGKKCTGAGPASMIIHEHVVNRNFGPDTRLTAIVGPDGSFTSQSGQTSMSGKIKNGHVELSIANPDCRTRQVLDRG